MYKFNKFPFLLFVTFSIAILAFGCVIGIATSPDGQTYVSIAKLMVDGQYFGETRPIAGFRMVGYPYLLHIIMSISESYHGYITLFFQYFVYLMASIFGFYYFRKQKTPDLVRIYFFIAVTLTLIWVSFSFLTDSLANSFIFISICLILFQFSSDKINIITILMAGILWLFAFLMRESIVYLTLTPLFLLLCRQWVIGKWQLRTLAACLIFMIPLGVGYFTIGTLNQARTGVFYITTGSKTVMLEALEKVAQKNPEVFDSDSDLDRLARETYKDFTFPETREINAKLHEIGYSSHEIVKIVGQKYKETWQEYPFGMLEKTWNELRIDRVIFGTFAPWRAFRRFWVWRYQKDVRQEIPGFADKILKIVSYCVSGSIMLPFMIYLLISAGKFCLRRQMTFSEKSSLIYGCAYFGFLMPFAMSHSELRYVWGASLLPLAVFCFAWKDWMPLFSKYVSSFFFRRKSEI